MVSTMMFDNDRLVVVDMFVSLTFTNDWLADKHIFHRGDSTTNQINMMVSFCCIWI